MPVLLKDAAEQAGVSRSAVSRKFTDGASVVGKMRRSLEKTAADLSYTRGALASSLTTVHQPIHQTICFPIKLIVKTLADPERCPEARLFPSTIIEQGSLNRSMYGTYE